MSGDTADVVEAAGHFRADHGADVGKTYAMLNANRQRRKLTLLRGQG
jgi:hypothetical protein